MSDDKLKTILQHLESVANYLEDRNECFDESNYATKEFVVERLETFRNSENYPAYKKKKRKQAHNRKIFLRKLHAEHKKKRKLKRNAIIYEEQKSEQRREKREEKQQKQLLQLQQQQQQKLQNITVYEMHEKHKRDELMKWQTKFPNIKEEEEQESQQQQQQQQQAISSEIVMVEQYGVTEGELVIENNHIEQRVGKIMKKEQVKGKSYINEIQGLLVRNNEHYVDEEEDDTDEHDDYEENLAQLKQFYDNQLKHKHDNDAEMKEIEKQQRQKNLKKQHNQNALLSSSSSSSTTTSAAASSSSSSLSISSVQYRHHNNNSNNNNINNTNTNNHHHYHHRQYRQQYQVLQDPVSSTQQDHPQLKIRIKTSRVVS